MAQTMTTESAAATGSKSLPARVGGVLFSPRATYADVAARPRWFGIFLTVFLITATAATALMSTEIGRHAVVDQRAGDRVAGLAGRNRNRAGRDAAVVHAA